MERDTAMEGKKPPVELQGLLERLLTEAEEGDVGPGAEGGSDSSASTLVRTPPGEGGALPGGLLTNPALLTALIQKIRNPLSHTRKCRGSSHLVLSLSPSSHFS